MENKQHPGISEEMIAAAKSKYGDNKIVTLDLPKDENETDFLTVLARKPDRQVKGEYLKWMEKNPNKADDILLNNCLLSHKEEVKADEGLISGAVDGLMKLFVIRTARNIKNL
jgi:hypothetical protein